MANTKHRREGGGGIWHQTSRWKLNCHYRTWQALFREGIFWRNVLACWYLLHTKIYYISVLLCTPSTSEKHKTKNLIMSWTKLREKEKKKKLWADSQKYFHRCQFLSFIDPKKQIILLTHKISWSTDMSTLRLNICPSISMSEADFYSAYEGFYFAVDWWYWDVLTL